MDESTDSDSPSELTPRDPSVEDVVALCQELIRGGCRYLVVGGFAIKHAGLARNTQDIDLLVDPSLESEPKVFDALATLPDGCVRELHAGDVERFTVVRVADRKCW